ncbi:hypothetical protein WN51_01825 [Melipona quadrifasciata]|uniref:Uncharacterized protein n=1 Tax=Melipona quadrifasciata TaxID=166423 RepID=A0A0N0BEZ8_9HYME|nr:hypothetical protein WN51_01825 [Melipona quadrifasciata]
MATEVYLYRRDENDKVVSKNCVKQDKRKARDFIYTLYQYITFISKRRSRWQEGTRFTRTPPFNPQVLCEYNECLPCQQPLCPNFDKFQLKLVLTLDFTNIPRICCVEIIRCGANINSYNKPVSNPRFVFSNRPTLGHSHPEQFQVSSYHYVTYRIAQVSDFNTEMPQVNFSNNTECGNEYIVPHKLVAKLGGQFIATFFGVQKSTERAGHSKYSKKGKEEAAEDSSAHTRRTCRKRAALTDLRDRYQILGDNRQLSLRKDCTLCRWVVRLTQTWQPRDSGNTDQRHVFISLS